jgi:hypothetical protein
MSEANITRLPSGGVGVHLPSGELADVAYITASTLVRMSDGDFAAVMAWVTGERERRAERTAENERAAAERVEAQRQQMEHRHQAPVKWAQENRL